MFFYSLLRWFATVLGVLFFILLARVHAEAEARSRRELFRLQQGI